MVIQGVPVAAYVEEALHMAVRPQDVFPGISISRRGLEALVLEEVHVDDMDGGIRRHENLHDGD
jgi:hypothetical protein